MKHFLLTILLLALPSSLFAEETEPKRPEATKYTKRTITDAAVIDLCDLTNARECVVWNQTDAPILIKYVEESATCTHVPITAGSDTDVIRVPAGATWSTVLGEKSSGADHTLCGKAESAVGSGHVYTAEAS